MRNYTVLFSILIDPVGNFFVNIYGTYLRKVECKEKSSHYLLYISYVDVDFLKYILLLYIAALFPFKMQFPCI